jgi:soluble lytic murein transglycosylase-like protein
MFERFLGKLDELPIEGLVEPVVLRLYTIGRKRFAISSARAFGLMQVMPFWVKELGDEPPSRLFEIDFNVLLGCYILKYYVDMERGNVMRGLARYNGSLGQTWYSDRVLQRLRTKWFRG